MNTINSDTSEDGITWVSANEFIEDQTRQIEREFHRSRPEPRNRAMGFDGEDPKPMKRKRRQLRS